MFFINTQNFTQGYIPSPDNILDYNLCSAIPLDTTTLESKFSWIDYDKITYNQGKLSICVGCASAGIKNIQESIEGDFPNGGLSPLYLYILCKQIDGIPYQLGTYPRTALHILNTKGALPEIDFPMNLLSENDQLNYPKVTDDMVNKALQYKITGYARVTNLSNINEIKKAIKVSPLLCGLIVTDDFIYAKDGFVYKPSGNFAGGHATIIYGWSDDLTHTYSNGVTEKGFLIGKNSWGNWGDNGKFYIPYNIVNWKSQEGMNFISEMWSSTDMINKKKFWRCQVGGFSVKQNCYNLVEKLKKQGLPTYIPPLKEDDLYRVQVNCFSIEANCRRYLEYIKGLGFTDAFLVYN